MWFFWQNNIAFIKLSYIKINVQQQMSLKFAVITQMHYSVAYFLLFFITLF